MIAILDIVGCKEDEREEKAGMMKRGSYKKDHVKNVDCERIWRLIFCDNCEKTTNHIYCVLKYRSESGYACFECGQERPRRIG